MKIYHIIAIVAALAVACAILASCSTQRRLARLASTHPDDMAELCARMFPVKQSNTVRTRTRSDTAYLPGEVKWVNCDSVLRLHRPEYPTSTLLVPVRCPDQRFVRDTIWRDSVVVEENTAAIAAERKRAEESIAKNHDQLIKAEKTASSLKASRNIWRWASIGLAAFYIITRLLRKFFKIPFL